jgi:hypothetical protein
MAADQLYTGGGNPVQTNKDASGSEIASFAYNSSARRVKVTAKRRINCTQWLQLVTLFEAPVQAVLWDFTTGGVHLEDFDTFAVGVQSMHNPPEFAAVVLSDVHEVTRLWSLLSEPLASRRRCEFNVFKDLQKASMWLQDAQDYSRRLLAGGEKQ